MQWKTTGLAASLAAVTYKVCSLALSLQNLNFSHCLSPKRVARCREFFLEPFTIGADVSARTRLRGSFFLSANHYLRSPQLEAAAGYSEADVSADVSASGDGTCNLPMGFALSNGKLHALLRYSQRSHTKYAPLLLPCKT